jgi:hypothetical protein
MPRRRFDPAGCLSRWGLPAEGIHQRFNYINYVSLISFYPSIDSLFLSSVDRPPSRSYNRHRRFSAWPHGCENARSLSVRSARTCIPVASTESSTRRIIWSSIDGKKASSRPNAPGADRSMTLAGYLEDERFPFRCLGAGKS